MTPSRLPIVNQFYAILADELLARDAEATAVKSLRNRLNPTSVPFELLMQTVHDTLADSAPQFVQELLSDVFMRGEPNSNHKILIDYLVSGKIELILTTNFDDLLFRTMPGALRRIVTPDEFSTIATELSAGRLSKPTVAHVHGSVTSPGSLVTLMSQVGKPLGGPLEETLELVKQNCVIVYVGYRGADVDIAPLLDRDARKHLDWWLVWHRERDDRLEQEVELDPLKTDATEAHSVVHERLDLLTRSGPADLLKLSGAVMTCAGLGLAATRRLHVGLSASWTPSAAVAYAASLASEHLYAMAADYLRDETPAINSRRLMRWRRDRAFYLRHLGKFDQAAQEYARARAILEPLVETEDRVDLIAEAMDLAEHEVECLLLIASSLNPRERTPVLAVCQQLLEKCGRWRDEAVQLPPTWEIDYYKAEYALLRGDYGSAAEQYRLAEAGATPWVGDHAPSLMRLRLAVALSGRRGRGAGRYLSRRGRSFGAGVGDASRGARCRDAG